MSGIDILDPYRLGCRLNEGPFTGCQHRTIRAISWNPRLSLAQFVNVEGLALPLKPNPRNMEGFYLRLGSSSHQAFGELHGRGRFAIQGRQLHDLEAGKELEAFVTYFFGPDPAEVHYLQTSPRLDRETREDWEARCQKAAPLRTWLAGESQPWPSPVSTLRATA